MTWILSAAFVAVISFVIFVELAFWLFCWCFGKVDAILQERYWRVVREQLSE